MSFVTVTNSTSFELEDLSKIESNILTVLAGISNQYAPLVLDHLELSEDMKDHVSKVSSEFIIVDMITKDNVKPVIQTIHTALGDYTSTEFMNLFDHTVAERLDYELTQFVIKNILMSVFVTIKLENMQLEKLAQILTVDFMQDNVKTNIK